MNAALVTFVFCTHEYTATVHSLADLRRFASKRRQEIKTYSIDCPGDFAEADLLAAMLSNGELDRRLQAAIDHQRIYEEGGDTADALFAERSRRIEAATAHTWAAGEQFDLYVNQADRDAQVLAVIGNQMIAEYEMPNGTTGIQLLNIEANTEGCAPFEWCRTYSYNRLPKKWLRAIREQGESPYWFGRCQRPGWSVGTHSPPPGNSEIERGASWPVPFPCT